MNSSLKVLFEKRRDNNDLAESYNLSVKTDNSDLKETVTRK